MLKARHCLLALVICVSVTYIQHVAYSAASDEFAAPEDLEVRVSQIERELLQLVDRTFSSTESCGVVLYRQELQQYFEDYVDRVDNERREFRATIENWGAWFVSFATVAFGFLSWRTHKDVFAFVEQETKKRISGLISERLGDVEERVNALYRMTERELLLRKSRLLVTGTEAGLAKMGNVIDIIKEEIGSVTCEVFDKEGIGQMCVERKHDLVIYAYVPSDDGEDPQLAELTGTMEESRWHIPVLVYTYGYDSRPKVSKYPLSEWLTFANSPMTLVANTYSLTRIFSGRKGMQE